MPGYIFIREVRSFDTDNCLPHLGWNAARITWYKIYTMEGSPSFFLHDESDDMMYEFSAADPSGLNSKEKYEQVVEMFEVWRNAGQ